MKVKEDQGRPSRLRQWLLAENPEPGSKSWYWSKRVEHTVLWMLPLVPLGYTLSSQGTSMPWPVLVSMLMPVVGSGIALGFVTHALWRIEINVAGNREHPFTVKDYAVLRRSAWILVNSLLFAVALDAVARFLLRESTSKAHLRFIDTGTNTAVIVALVGSVVVATMSRIHCKARHAYEELEKGV